MNTKLTHYIQQVCCLSACVLVLVSLAVIQYGELFGHSLRGEDTTAPADTLRTLADGTIVVNTAPLANDILGYGGRVPLEITVKDSVITEIRPLGNAESTDFFAQAVNVLNAYKGKTVSQAAAMHVDAVSGATLSSTALIGNMSRGLQYLQQQPAAQPQPKPFPLKTAVGLVVVLMAAVLPLFVRNRTYLLIQQVLNIIVLGFWCGTALSYSSMTGYLAHGAAIAAFAIPAVMLITAFVYPLFGKKSYYCTFVCPFGALQQVAGRCVKYKLPLRPRTLHYLDIFRQVLWAALMLCIWSGVWSRWTDYEPFSAFIFRSASWVTIAIAATFIALSFVITRPYCRFVCPVGTLLKTSQTTK